MAIFGGTFDPPHIAHVDLLAQAQKAFGFSKVFVVPSKFPPGKTPFAEYEKRFHWAEKAFDRPGIEVSNIEKSAEQTVFGFDIYAALQAQNPEIKFFWILGEDQWESLPYWKRINDYGSNLTWLVLPRTDDHSRPSGLLSRRLLGASCPYYWATGKTMPEVSSTELRDELGIEAHAAWIPESIREEVKDYYQQKKKNKNKTEG